jgi:hypothetical protein
MEREMVYLYMKKRSESDTKSTLTEEKIAKVVAVQVERKLARYSPPLLFPFIVFRQYNIFIILFVF